MSSVQVIVSDMHQGEGATMDWNKYHIHTSNYGDIKLSDPDGNTINISVMDWAGVVRFVNQKLAEVQSYNQAIKYVQAEIEKGPVLGE